jgi:hypothetical protein
MFTNIISFIFSAGECFIQCLRQHVRENNIILCVGYAGENCVNLTLEILVLIINQIDIDLNSLSVSESVSISIVIVSHHSIVFVVMLFGL